MLGGESSQIPLIFSHSLLFQIPDEQCWDEPEEKCWKEPVENCWEVSLRYLSVQYLKHCYFQVSDEECEDIPSERCEAVNVKVARRKCGEQEESSYGH